MLKISNLTYSISHSTILSGLNLSVDSGQYYALAGENGAGKSTLIKIILDLIRNMDCDEITINGHDNKLLVTREQIAFLPEKFDVKRDVTGWQYLEFVFGIYRQQVDKDKVLTLCQHLCLDDAKLQDVTRSYSKGMKQKLGLISCFMLENPLIILDEPLSGLDPKARFLFKQLLEEERKNNRTVFYSTHMLEDAMEICDRFGILHQGKIIFEGTPQQCLDRYRAKTLEQAYMSCISGYAE